MNWKGLDFACDTDISQDFNFSNVTISLAMLMYGLS